jgi:ketosteroid isomerase-like protein
MSQADIETLRVVYAAAGRGDWDAVLSAVHPDFEWKTTLVGTHRGHDEVRRFFEDQREPFDQLVAEPEEFFGRGGRIVVFLRVRYQPRGTTVVPPEVRVGHLWTMREGRAVRCETFPKREEALKAAGLTAQDAYADS